MTEIILYGALRKKFGKSYNLSVSSAKEAVNALSLLVPNFKHEFTKYDYSMYSVVNDVKVYLQADEIDENLVIDKLHVLPVIIGSKSSSQKGVGKVILSAALFFVAGPLGNVLQTAGAAASTASGVVSAVQDVAMFMALSGVSAMLTPKVKPAPDSKDSFQLSSENSVNGNAVPLAYGVGYFDVLPISVEISASGVRPTVVTSSGQTSWQVGAI